MEPIKISCTILAIEDSDEDFEALLRALKRTGVAGGDVFRCETGEEALDYIFRTGRFLSPECAPRPAIVLLDLNIPGTDGLGVLTRIKGNDNTKDIPVIIFSTSENYTDVGRCYLSGANAYIKKPQDLESFYSVIARIKEFWFNTVILPGVRR